MEHLKRCLESISNSILPKEHELIIIVNGSDADTINFLQNFSQNNINLHFHSIERSSNGRARNEGIKYAKGEILYFLDDDVTVDKNIFQETINKFREYPDVDIIGGPNLTPEGSSLFQRCFGYVLESTFGAANMRRRWIAIGEDILTNDKSLILCNLAIRKRVFHKEKNHFNSDLICAEENLLLQQLKSKRYKMLYSPKLIVYHERRKNLREFAQQIFKYGKGRMQQTLQLPASLPLFSILPTLFILYLISILFFHKIFYLSPLFAYLFLDTFFSFQIVLRHKSIILFPLSLIIFPIVHISYGLGLLSGLIMQHK
jgi:glycosyltransferase involved in cell wall biosynthesis